MCVGSPTAGAWSSFQRRPDDEFETDRRTVGLSARVRRALRAVRPGREQRPLNQQVALSRRAAYTGLVTTEDEYVVTGRDR